MPMVEARAFSSGSTIAERPAAAGRRLVRAPPLSLSALPLVPAVAVAGAAVVSVTRILPENDWQHGGDKDRQRLQPLSSRPAVSHGGLQELRLLAVAFLCRSYGCGP